MAGNESSRISTNLKNAGIACLAALTMVTHDLSVDPLQATVRKLWLWEGGGAYFGVPLHNFVDWFFVTFFFLFCYRYLTNSAEAMEFISTRTAPRFYLPAILVYLAFGVGTMLHPLIFGETEIGLAMSGVAMFATTIPVLAAVLSLYRDRRPVGTVHQSVPVAAAEGG